MMSNSTNFFHDLIKEHTLNLHTAMPCKVLSFNEQARTAKIQPLFMYKEKNQEPVTRAPIEDVPVLFQRYKTVDTRATSEEPLQYSDEEVVREFIPILQQGDIVFAVFSQRALDDVLQGNVAFPAQKRHHSLNDAIIVGVIN